MATTVYIPLENLEKFKKKIGKLNKIAAKLGCVPISVKYGPTVFKKVKVRSENADVEFDAAPTELTQHETEVLKLYYLEYQEVTVEGEAPVKAGWKFVGTLQHDFEQAIVAGIPGVEIPERYFNAKASTCEHCNKVRLRRDTYLVRNEETGEFKQVGKACLKDFLGHIDPSALAAYMEWIIHLETNTEEDESGFPPRDRLCIETVALAGHAVRCLRVFGFVSRKAAESQNMFSTVDAIEKSYTGERRTKYEDRLFKEPPTAEDYATGKEALAALRANTKPTRNEFEHNVAVVAAQEYIGFRNIGIFAAGIQSWLKAKVIEEKRKQEAAERKPSEFVGEVGKRIDLEVKVIFHTTFQGDFGITHLFKMIDKNDCLFTWFGTGQNAKMVSDLMISGEFFAVKGSIKKHEVYKDQKQTVLTRVTVK